MIAFRIDPTERLESTTEMSQDSSPKVTACLVTYNEEEGILAALNSVAFVDEIVVVDSHSTDRTREIVRAFRGRNRRGEVVEPRVIERDWPGHVEQKNFAVTSASHDWVLCLDADERLSAEARSAVEQVLSEPPDADGYSFARKTFYLGRWILHGGWYPDRKLRLFRRSAGQWGGVNPHDHVYVNGRSRALEGDILHYSYRAIEEHIRQINFFTDIAAAEKHKAGVRFPVLRMLLHGPLKFFKMYFLQLGFRDGRAGFLVASLGAYYVFLKYAKLWELQMDGWRKSPDETRVVRADP